MCRSRPRCSLPPARAGSGRSTVSVCCCIRRAAGSSAGSVCGHRSRRPCAHMSRLILSRNRSRRARGNNPGGTGLSGWRRWVACGFQEDVMRKMTRRAFGAAGFALAFATTASLAQQQPQTTRIRAMIEKVDGGVLMVKARNGDQLKVTMADNARYAAMIKATLEDLKPDTYIGVTSMPQPDGTLKAVAIHIFQPNQRGT